jgi:AcrR family transcriptional regulator
MSSEDRTAWVNDQRARTPRERYRAQIRDEIKQVALGQLAELGPAGVSVNAIGKELGVSGPALYRYFAGRDELLTELVIDAYADMAAALRAATANVTGRTPRSSLEALARAYRQWAISQPHRYRLLYSPPLPGYDPNSPRHVEAAQASMRLLLEALPPAIGSMRPPKGLAAEAADWIKAQGLTADTSAALQAVRTWSRLHGFVSLEIAGAFASMGLDSDALFDLELPGLGT